MMIAEVTQTFIILPDQLSRIFLLPTAWPGPDQTFCTSRPSVRLKCKCNLPSSTVMLNFEHLSPTAWVKPFVILVPRLNRSDTSLNFLL